MENWTDPFEVDPFEVDPFEVYYDVTRLVERMNAGHATGVDRVDLHYALWMRARASEWRAVVQRRNGFVCLNADDMNVLFSDLSERWLGGVERRAVLDPRQPMWWLRESRKALHEKLSRGSFEEVLAERGFVAALWSRLPCVSRGRSAASGFWEDCSNAIYVNIGHCFRFETAMQSIPATMRRIYFLHDVIPLTHPEYQKPTSAAHFKKFCEYIGHSKSDVIVSSQATLDAIAGLPEDARALLNSASSIRVCPLAVEERFMAQRLKSLKGGRVEGLKVDERKDSKVRDYFLSVGTIEPRKNLELLVRVWEQLLDSGGAIPKLIWVGKFGWSNDKQLMRRFERLQALGHVELCSGVPDADLLRLMQGAIALLFPSKVEGWGLPLSEAFAMGVPVIASDITVFREVGQGVPELLELEDVEGWQSMIVQYAMADSAFRALQIQRMRRNEPLAWAQHFEQLEALLNAQGLG